MNTPTKAQIDTILFHALPACLSSAKEVNGVALSEATKRVFAYLYTFIRQGKIARPGQDLICYNVAMDERSVRRCIKSLEESGLLFVKRAKRGAPNIYTVDWDLMFGLNALHEEKQREMEEARYTNEPGMPMRGGLIRKGDDVTMVTAPEKKAAKDAKKIAEQVQQQLADLDDSRTFCPFVGPEEVEYEHTPYASSEAPQEAQEEEAKPTYQETVEPLTTSPVSSVSLSDFIEDEPNNAIIEAEEPVEAVEVQPVASVMQPDAPTYSNVEEGWASIRNSFFNGATDKDGDPY